jgi:FkbM family methyltransferase
VTPTLVDAEIFGARFKIVEPASIGLPRHSTDEFRDHEPVMDRWVLGIESGDLVIDGGASFGNYTLPALARGARAVCYEPYHEHAAILRANIDANGWARHAVVREVGLWDGTPYPEGILRQMQMRLDMPTVRLDDESAVDLDPMGGLVHLKLDIEGTELGALLGAQRFLAAHHPRIIIEDHEGVSPSPECEISRYPERIESGRRMRELLVGLGYRIEVVPWDVSRKYWVCEHPNT